MNKKKFKAWLIKVLRKWISKLSPEENVLKIEHVLVPLVTLNASLTLPKANQWSEDRINEILAKELSKEVIKYADVQHCEKFDMNIFDEQIIYRAQIRVAADKRG